jgi:hypothetical protein
MRLNSAAENGPGRVELPAASSLLFADVHRWRVYKPFRSGTVRCSSLKYVGVGSGVGVTLACSCSCSLRNLTHQPDTVLGSVSGTGQSGEAPCFHEAIMTPAGTRVLATSYTPARSYTCSTVRIIVSPVLHTCRVCCPGVRCNRWCWNERRLTEDDHLPSISTDCYFTLGSRCIRPRWFPSVSRT